MKARLPLHLWRIIVCVSLSLIPVYAGTTGQITTGTGTGWYEPVNGTTGDIFTDNRNADGTGVLDPTANAIVLTHNPGQTTSFALRMGAGGDAAAGTTWGNIEINVLGGELGLRASNVATAITEALIGGYYSTEVTDRLVHGNTTVTIGSVGTAGPDLYGFVLTTGGGTITGNANLVMNSGRILVSPIGTLKRNGGVFGASYEGTVKGNSTMWFNGGSIEVDSYGNMGLFGGGYYATVEGNTYVNLNGTHVKCFVYGGGKGKSGQSNSIVGGNAYVNLIAGTVDKNIFGGGHERSTVQGSTFVTITGGLAKGNIYGGTASNTGHIEGDANVALKDNANVSGSVYGGGSSYGNIGGNVSVSVTGNAVIAGSIYAAGASYGSIGGDSNILITDQAQIQGSVSAGTSYVTNNDNIAGKIKGDSKIILQGNDWSIGGTISGDSKSKKSNLSNVSGTRSLIFDKVNNKQVDNTLSAFDNVTLQGGSVQNLVNVTELKNLYIIDKSTLTDKFDRTDLHSFIVNDSTAHMNTATVMDVASIEFSKNSTINIDEHILNVGGSLATENLENSLISNSNVNFTNKAQLNLVTDGTTTPRLDIIGTEITMNDESEINITTDGTAGPQVNISSSDITLTNNAAIKVDTDGQAGASLYINGSAITMGDSSSTGYIAQSTGGTISSTADKNISMVNSSVEGVGILKGIQAMNSRFKVGFGNAPGVMETANFRAYDSVLSADIFSYNNASNILLDGMNDSAEEYSGGLTGNVSQYHVTDNMFISGATQFEFSVINGDGTTALNTQDLKNGAKFEFFNIDAGSKIEGSFTIDLNKMPALADGLVWDIRHLSSDGYIAVISVIDPDPDPNPGPDPDPDPDPDPKPPVCPDPAPEITKGGEGGRVVDTLVSGATSVHGFAMTALTHLKFHNTGNNIWVAGFGQYNDYESRKGRVGFKFNGTGYAVGTTRQFSDKLVMGLAFGHMFGTHTPNSGNSLYSAGKIDQTGIMGTAYGRYVFTTPEERDQIYTDAYFAGGNIHNRSRKMAFYNYHDAKANWNDAILSSGLMTTWKRRLNPCGTAISVFSGVNFVRAMQGDFMESGSGTRTLYHDGSYQNWTASVGTGIERPFALKNGMILTPSLSASYLGDFSRKDPSVRAWYAGRDVPTREKGVSPGRNGLLINTGAHWKINNRWNMGAYYEYELRRGLQNQAFNVVIDYSF